jgi:starvation-inducible DNA-binding protein
MPLALDEKVRAARAANRNQVLVDTMTLRDLYKKHHWDVPLNRQDLAAG